jgi:hypothetical protein
VTFRIKPALPLLPGTSIENTSNIYFDYNPPVITEPSVLVAEFSTGVLEVVVDQIRIFPNPATDQLSLLRIGSGSTNGTWQILSVDGRVVLQGRSEGALTTIALTGLTSGHYVLRAQTNDGVLVRTFNKHN